MHTPGKKFGILNGYDFMSPIRMDGVPSKTVLVIEDERDLLNEYTKALEARHFAVIQASDGVEGLAILNTLHPDLILLDIILPKKHGFDVLTEIKGTEDTAKIPVIVLSNLAGSENELKGKNLGAAKYFVKNNISFDQVALEVEQCLR